jgi:amidohydrolase
MQIYSYLVIIKTKQQKNISIFKKAPNILSLVIYSRNWNSMKILTELYAKYADEILNHRQHLHQFPELSYQEFETQKYILQFLSHTKVDDYGKLANTGAWAHIKGKSSAKSVILRADIDALPIQEQNDVPYKSKNNGVMHACGHDVHSSCAMGAIRLLLEMKDQLEGDVFVLFQPAEERLPGGATLVIEEGWLQKWNSNAIFALHVEPEMEIGKFGIGPGPFMAASDELYIQIYGKGGHGAKPHKTIDPIAISADVINNLQKIVSRKANPLYPTVVTIGKINSNGGATNIIPDSVSMEGTLRTFNEEWRKEAYQWIREIIEHTCQAYGAKSEIEIKRGYPALINDEKLYHQTEKILEMQFGKSSIQHMPARMGAEDFAFYSELMPASFIRLGSQNPNKTAIHTATFDIHEKALETGSIALASLALHYLSSI